MDPHTLIQKAEAFTDLDPLMSINHMLTFLYIARRGQASQQDIESELGLSGASASRNISYWTDMKFFGRPGHGFIERFEDPTDRRYKLVRLSPLGREFYEKLRSNPNGTTKRD
jgi:DNA-binding MarR family transcriptional regulator